MSSRKKAEQPGGTDYDAKSWGDPGGSADPGNSRQISFHQVKECKEAWEWHIEAASRR